MLTYDLSKRGNTSLYEFLYRSIRKDIVNEQLSAGEKLPSKRSLAAHLGISVMTVENAYGQLQSEGYIESKPKSGFYVVKLSPAPSPVKYTFSPPIIKKKEYLLDFVSGRTDASLFPFSVWSKLSRKTLSEQSSILLDRCPVAGVTILREQIARYLASSKGIIVPVENIIIGAGTEYLYGILTALLGRERVYAIETPGYTKIRKCYQSENVSVQPISMDEEGIKIEELKKSSATVLHISPAHHYPTGIVTSAKRRSEILSWAEEKNGYIIEDDYDSEFPFSGKPIPPLQSLDRTGKVIYVNTFSKILAPSIRISYMILPSMLLKEFYSRFGFYSCPVPVFEQYTLAEFMQGGYFERQINRLRTQYRLRRDELIPWLKKQSHEKIKIFRQDAGLHFLVKFYTEKTDVQLAKEWEEKGIHISFLSQYAYLPDDCLNHIAVINYTGSHLPSLLKKS